VGESDSRSEAHGRIGVIVVVSVVVFVLSGLAYVSATMPLILTDRVAGVAIDTILGLLGRFPNKTGSALIMLTFYLSRLGLLVGCSVSLIFGLRAWRMSGPRVRSVALVTGGGLLAVFLCCGALSFYAYVRSMGDRNAEQSKVISERLRTRLESGEISPGQRQRVWRMYARGVYWRDGASVEIPDEGGQNSPYQPSEREVASRKSYLEMRQGFRPPYGSAIFGIVFVAMSVMLGLLTPLSKRPPGSRCAS